MRTTHSLFADDRRIRYEHYGRALRSQGLRVVQVEGDGNCLFRSVSHQIYGDDSHHRLVRARCMDYMEVREGWCELPAAAFGAVLVPYLCAINPGSS